MVQGAWAGGDSAAVKQVLKRSSPKKHLAPKIPLALEKIESSQKKTKTFEADFEQTTFQATMGTTKSQKGHIWFESPGKLRWEEREPDQTLLITNGVTLWHYTPPFDKDSRGQVLIAPYKQTLSKVTSALMAGTFSELVKWAKIEQKSPEQFVFYFKKNSAGSLNKAEMILDSKDPLLVSSISLFHEGGNESKILLKNMVRGIKIDPLKFLFEMPPHTDIVKQ